MSARLLIAGVASGVGKTTLATGLLAAFRRRGLAVRPFKVGPDYLDPEWHALAAGTPGRNLDAWLVPRDRLRALFAAAAAGADLALVEGVMGLYDGAEYLGEAGSTAELAKLLAIPTVLVLDVRAQARSAAATALGFRRLDPAVPLVGVICNRVGSAGHYVGVKAAIEAATALPVLGGLPRLARGAIPERHLGLVRADEGAESAALVAALADAVEEGCDLDALLGLAGAAPPLPGGVAHLPPRSDGPRPVIAYARDAAFSFYYAENLDLLRHCGADLRPFSPLADATLPPDAAAIYLGGGYPELHAAPLAANRPLRDALRAAIAAGMPCYAECGGLMYLTEGLVDLDGRCHPMVGALPGRAVMRHQRSHLGYATVRALADTPLLRAGEAMRGHEFHYSTWEGQPPDCPRAYLVEPRRGAAGRPEGYARGNLLATYVHLHFWSEPLLARRFVAAAAAYRANRGVTDVTPG
ncbi:MAG: cobyrinate a,c-diamide synthase [Chloroflexota bacterium]|nr:cobyrinate a,c-diamide synthase [Chloroflexota bacterium]